MPSVAHKAIIEEAKSRATEEGNKIVAAARVEADQQALKARDALREQVAALAVKGAEQILRKEVNPGRARRFALPPADRALKRHG